MSKIIAVYAMGISWKSHFPLGSGYLNQCSLCVGQITASGMLPHLSWQDSSWFRGSTCRNDHSLPCSTLA